MPANNKLKTSHSIRVKKGLLKYKAISMIKTKFCWTATQTKKGWRLKFSTEKGDYNVVGLLFDGKKDVKQALEGGIVFVEK